MSKKTKPRQFQFSMREIDIERLDALVDHFQELAESVHSRSSVVRGLILAAYKQKGLEQSGAES